MAIVNVAGCRLLLRRGVQGSDEYSKNRRLKVCEPELRQHWPIAPVYDDLARVDTVASVDRADS